MLGKSKTISITISSVTIGLKETDLGEEKIEVTIFEPMKLFKLKRRLKDQIYSASILFSNIKSSSLKDSAVSGRLILNLIDEVDLSKIGLSKFSGIFSLSFKNLEEQMFFEFSEVYLKNFEADSKIMISNSDINNSKTENFLKSAIKKAKQGTKSESKKDPFFLISDEKADSESKKKNWNLIKKDDNPMTSWYNDEDIEYGLE